jgi:tetratricopeptide repeat protein
MTPGRILGAVLLLTVSGSARADPRSDARDRLEEGSALYRKGDYQGALDKFEEARALAPSPKIYFNLGQALNRLGRTAAAIDAFERFLAEAPDAAAERRRDAEGLLEELRPRVGHLRVIAEPGSEITVDGEPVGTAPLRRTIALDPGLHEVTALAPGARVGHVGTVEIAPGQTADWEGKQAPAPLADEPPPPIPPLPLTTPPTRPALVESAPPPRQRSPWLPWVAGAGAVVVAVALTALVVSSGSRSGPNGTLGHVDLR